MDFITLTLEAKLIYWLVSEYIKICHMYLNGFYNPNITTEFISAK